MFKCKVQGMVDSDGCYTCFITRQNGREYASRVLCKRENITEEMEVQAEMTTATES